MRFGPYILRRLLLSIVVLLGLSIIIFVIARVVPGDPARLSLGPRAPQDVVDALRKELHMDRPLPEQYWIWLTNALQGDLGKSLVSKRPVIQDVAQYLPATLELVFFAAIFMVFFAILLGTLAARYKDTWVDGMIRTLSYFGVSIPAFVVAILFILLFGYFWPILPVLSRASPSFSIPTITGFKVLDSLIAGNIPAVWDAFKHLILPVVALALGGTFQEARITRSGIVDNANKDFISAERGLSLIHI